MSTTTAIQSYAPTSGLLLALFFLMQFSVLSAVPAACAEDQLFIDTQQLAEHGDCEAQFSLGLMYDTGDLGKRDPKLAVYWFARAAAAGVAGACLYLGMKYEFGVQVAQDKKKAQHWYEQAALQDWPQAAFMLANLYLNAAPVDRISGCAWMAIARDHEFPGADQLHRQYCLHLGRDEARKSTQLTTRLQQQIDTAGPLLQSR